MSDPSMQPGLVDTSRAETFSDGVLAIAITLLVLGIGIPAHRPGTLWVGLGRQWPEYVGYLASFLYIAVIWLNHHAAFRRIRLMDRGLQWANLGILLTTVLLPFPTAVLASALQEHSEADAAVAAGLYALVAALMCASWSVFYHYLWRNVHLVEENVDERFFHRERLRALVGITLYALAGVLGYLLAPVLALAIFVVLPIFYGVTSEGLPGRRASRR
jgi:uncharacterized membrane protein